MSEKYDEQELSLEKRKELSLISERLANVAEELKNLSESEKDFVIENFDKLNSLGMLGLFDLLLEYLEF